MSNVNDLEMKVENHILGLLRNRVIGDPVRSLLLSCMTTYSRDVNFYIRHIIGLLAIKDFKWAEVSVEVLVREAKSCGESFTKGKVKSPIAKDTKALDDLSLVAYGLIKYVNFYFPPSVN